MAAGLTSKPGSEPPDQAIGPVAGEVLEEAERHLAAAGVVHAQEQHDGLAVAAQTLHFGQRGQALAGEAFGDAVAGSSGTVLVAANWS